MVITLHYKTVYSGPSKKKYTVHYGICLGKTIEISELSVTAIPGRRAGCCWSSVTPRRRCASCCLHTAPARSCLSLSDESLSAACKYTHTAVFNTSTWHSNDFLLTIAESSTDLHTHTRPFNGPLSRTTRVSWYQKGRTNLDFTEARDSETVALAGPYARLHLAPGR